MVTAVVAGDKNGNGRVDALDARQAAIAAASKTYTSLEQLGLVLGEETPEKIFNAMPDGSVNAAYIACELLSKCKLLCASDIKILKNGAYFLSDVHGNSFDIASSDDKFGATTSANGMVKMKDGRLSFSCDVRYGSTYSASELEGRINKCVEERGWKVTEIITRKAFSTKETIPLQTLC